MKTLTKCLLLCLWFVPFLLPAAIGGRNMEREAEIEVDLAKRDASMVQPFREARIAYDKDDFATAKRLLLEVTGRLPDFDPALRRLGSIMNIEGHHQDAIRYCEKAVSINRSSANLVTLASVHGFPRSGTSADAEKSLALSLLSEARQLAHGDDADVLLMRAQLAFQLGYKSVARETCAELERKYPNEIETHYFAAVSAAMDEHWVKADREIRIARKLGLSEKETERFLDSGVRARAWGWWAAGAAGVAVGIWLVGLVLLFVLGIVLSKATLRQAHRADASVPASAGEIRLRRLYRFVLNAAGIYYYLSLPIVVVLVIGVCAAVIFAFLDIGFVPLKLTALLAIGGLVTVYTMCKSLFLKLGGGDPGRPLARHEAEGLWQLVEEVAQTMNTRPIDEIRITAGTELAVYEKGSWREKLNNRAKRVLILGAAVINGFKQEDFRCVLAHEYGHFSNRDTAGGDIAMRVQNDMTKFYLKMCEAGQATKINIAFHFLRIYHFIFRRISHGATRLQEILADRVAAQAYGPAAFEAGLRHVIHQTMAFASQADLEITDAIKSSRPLNNLYDAPLTESPSLQQQFDVALTRPTSEDDTHPGPAERFRLIARIPDPARHPTPGEVWDLFLDRAAITRELMAQIEANVAPHRGPAR